MTGNLRNRRRPRERTASKAIALCIICAFTALLGLTASSVAGSSDEKAITFTKDVAAIFNKRCAECHRPNDIAPFSVLSYKDVRPWARSIREKVITREMPPWHADPHFGDFSNDARLTQNEIDTVVAWVDQGAKEGEPEDLPSAPAQSDGWRIRTPDLVLAMPREVTVEPDAGDRYVYAIVRNMFKEDRWVQAAEVRPTNRRVVHHAIAHVVTPDASTRARESEGGRDREKELAIFYKDGGLSRVKTDAPVIDDGASSPRGGSVFKRGSDADSDVLTNWLTSYAPGKGPDIYPQGMAKLVPAGSSIVIQVHYSAFQGRPGQPEKDRTYVGLVFAGKPAEKEVKTLTIQNHYFRIPAGADSHLVTASYTIDEEAHLISYMPHMHLRGKDMKYEVIYPGGRRETLLWVPRYNFGWQTVYWLKSPMTIPKGTRFIVTAHFDNSRGNKYNPDPTRDVRWGERTDDEMMMGYIEYFVEKPGPSGK